MISAMAASGIAIGSASLISYALMTRWRNSEQTRRAARGGCDASNYATDEGWTHGSGFGHSMSDDSGNPSDSGGGDDGGGSDGGGGGDGGSD